MEPSRTIFKVLFSNYSILFATIQNHMIIKRRKLRPLYQDLVTVWFFAPFLKLMLKTVVAGGAKSVFRYNEMMIPFQVTRWRLSSWRMCSLPLVVR